MAYDLKSESQVKEYIHNLGIEYRFGCYSEKKPEVCHLLGDYLEAVKKDFEKASKVYKSNCDDYNYGKSCHKFGNFNLIGRGQNKENYTEAYKYFEKGCNLNEPDSCLNQGLMLVSNNFNTKIEKDVLKGMNALEKACNGNNATACYYLSGMYISGVKRDDGNKKIENKTKVDSKTKIEKIEKIEKEKDNKTNVFDVPKDMKKAFGFALKGCSLGNMYSCANLSQMYLRGDGIEKDLELAEKYKKKALELQDELANAKQTLTFQEGLTT